MLRKKHFEQKNSQHGGMLVELMMTIALAAIIIPFVFRYQQTSVSRARNIAVAKQMENVQNVMLKKKLKMKLVNTFMIKL